MSEASPDAITYVIATNAFMEEQKKYPNRGRSYPHRLLKALSEIMENENVSTADRLQAAKLALETLPHRIIPRKKTEKEKAVIKALEGTKKAGAIKPPPPEPEKLD